MFSPDARQCHSRGLSALSRVPLPHRDPVQVHIREKGAIVLSHIQGQIGELSD